MSSFASLVLRTQGSKLFRRMPVAYLRTLGTCAIVPRVSGIPGSRTALPSVFKRSFKKVNVGMNPISLTIYEEKEIYDRVLKICKQHDSLQPIGEKVTLDSHFIDELGLDSLEQIEILSDIELDFGLEIPDDVSETLFTPRQIAQYLATRPALF